ncbi:MAG: YigZ family protein [Clostridia bacterium]|nr:YigZ family protein [Clostridia bacterium]
MNDSYITVLSSASDEVVIQKSRFIGYASPCETEEDAQRFIREIREKHRDARHHCYAYVIGLNSGIMRYSDDGEPGGTAGMPMMDVLKSRQAVNCCVVVVRYFGGILLGTGGLVRAYTQGCKIALDAAGLVRMELSCLLRCNTSYSSWNTVQYALQKLPVQLSGVEYQENVRFLLSVRKEDTEETVRTLKNLSDGKIDCVLLSEEYRAWDL